MNTNYPILAAVYRYLLVPLLLLLGALLYPFVPKIRKGLSLRKNAFQKENFPQLQADQEVFWFHCSSGELEYAKPIFRELKSANKNAYLLCTYYSPSVLSNLQKTKEVDCFLPTPLENTKDYDKILSHFRPKALFVARTDIWPIMLESAKKFHIPSYLFSATFTKESGRYKSFLARSFYSYAHSLFKHVFCVTEEDKQCFLALNPELSVSVDGDTRYDQVLWRLQNSTENLIQRKAASKIILCGSTWAEDEKFLLESISPLKEKHPELQWILTPHEPTKMHINSLCEQLQKQKISFQLFSQSKDFQADLMIVDQVGVLASLYKEADIAFIGGSFKSSIHSVMEGLAAGCFSVYGPFYHNNREAIEFLSLGFQKQAYAASCKNVADLIRELDLFLKQKPDFRMQFRQALIEEIRKRSGLSRKIFSAIQKISAI